MTKMKKIKMRLKNGNHVIYQKNISIMLILKRRLASVILQKKNYPNL